MTLLKYNNEIKGDMAMINADVTSTRTCKTVINWAPGSHFHRIEKLKIRDQYNMQQLQNKGFNHLNILHIAIPLEEGAEI